MVSMGAVLLAEKDAILVLDCSEDFLIYAVNMGRVACVHVDGEHMFTLSSLLEAKQEMVSKRSEFFTDARSAVSASRLDPSYF